MPVEFTFMQKKVCYVDTIFLEERDPVDTLLLFHLVRRAHNIDIHDINDS